MRQRFRELKRRNVYGGVTCRVAVVPAANPAVDLLRPDEAGAKIGDREGAPWRS